MLLEPDHLTCKYFAHQTKDPWIAYWLWLHFSLYKATITLTFDYLTPDSEEILPILYEQWYNDFGWIWYNVCCFFKRWDSNQNFKPFIDTVCELWPNDLKQNVSSASTCLMESFSMSHGLHLLIGKQFI